MSDYKFNKTGIIIFGICIIFFIIIVSAFQYIPQDNNSTKSNIENKRNINSKISDDRDEIRDRDRDVEDRFSDKSRKNRLDRSKRNLIDEIDENNEIDIDDETDYDDDENTNYSYESPEIKPDSSLDKYTNEDKEKDGLLDFIKNPDVSTNKKKEKLQPLDDIDVEPIDVNKTSQKDIIKNAERFEKSGDYNSALNLYKEAFESSEKSASNVELNDKIAKLYVLQKDYEQAIPYARNAYKANQTIQRELFLTKLYYKTGEVDKATDRINLILQRDFELDK